MTKPVVLLGAVTLDVFLSVMAFDVGQIAGWSGARLAQVCERVLELFAVYSDVADELARINAVPAIQVGDRARLWVECKPSGVETHDQWVEDAASFYQKLAEILRHCDSRNTVLEAVEAAFPVRGNAQN